MRLFIAINFSEEIKDALCETIADLRDASRRGRYTHRDNLHLTLAFIGESDRV
ncbi:MAG: RNA 2',3'-cyclic phosphodiesterase, partial [Clostridiales Family XIII bacterium]|nr:RNA 2',3'-cyclic phosphodiesterase [Clostridiales Family XIII bacterium]